MVIKKIRDIGPLVDSMVIFDRDGTLSEDFGAMSGNSKCRILPNVFEGLKIILNPLTSFAIATNQSYIGRGVLKLKEVEEFNTKLLNILKTIELDINFIAICPHTPEDNCVCRKPKPGMINELVRLSGIKDRDRIFFIGDKESDQQAAFDAGIISMNLEKMDFEEACKLISEQLNLAGK